MSGAPTSWVVLQWAAGALAVALVLPLVLPAERRHRGGAARIVLALAVGLALAAAGAVTNDMDAPGRLLRLAAILALVCGLIALLGLVLFDLVLPILRLDVPSILRDVLQLAVAAIAVMTCLRLAGLDVLPILTTSAVLTAVIGLALQATIANLFGGLSLQLDRTLVQGDWIETGTYSGRIVEIGWRSTQLVTKDGDTVFLPNSQLVSGEVLNLSRPTGIHRASVRLNVNHVYAPSRVRDVLVEAIRDVSGVLAYPPPDCVIEELGEPHVVYAVRYWIAEFERDAGIASEVRSRLWYAARRAALDPVRQVLEVALPKAEVDGRASVADLQREHEELLGRVALLAPLDAASRQRLASRLRRLDFAPGEPIVRQGTSGDELYVVARGTVGVRLEVDGSISDVATLGAGEFFGEMSVLTGEPRSATCTARTEVTCYVIERAAFEELLAEQPEIAELLSKTLAARQTALAAQRENLSSAARARIEADHQSRLLGRMRDFLGISRA